MSFPTIVDARGIGGAVPLNLDPAEQKALTRSIEGIQRQIAVIEEAATASWPRNVTLRNGQILAQVGKVASKIRKKSNLVLPRC
jgi:hypothetical protein